MKKITPKIIDYTQETNFLCMFEDAKLLQNLIEQRVRKYRKKTDYIQLGIGVGQPLGSVLQEITKSIQNHLDYFEKNHILIL